MHVLHVQPLLLLPAEVADDDQGQDEEHERQEGNEDDEDGVLEIDSVGRRWSVVPCSSIWNEGMTGVTRR